MTGRLARGFVAQPHCLAHVVQGFSAVRGPRSDHVEWAPDQMEDMPESDVFINWHKIRCFRIFRRIVKLTGVHHIWPRDRAPSANALVTEAYAIDAEETVDAVGAAAPTASDEDVFGITTARRVTQVVTGWLAC